jgi:hypothetical protein
MKSRTQFWVQFFKPNKLLFWFWFTFWVQFSSRQQTLVSILVQFVLTRTNNSYPPKRVPTQHHWYAPVWLDFLSLLPVKEPACKFWVYGPFDQRFSKNQRTTTCTSPQPLIWGFWGGALSQSLSIFAIGCTNAVFTFP